MGGLGGRYVSFLPWLSLWLPGGSREPFFSGDCGVIVLFLGGAWVGRWGRKGAKRETICFSFSFLLGHGYLLIPVAVTNLLQLLLQERESGAG